MQSKLGSFVEAAANVAVGYGIALISQLMISLYGVRLPLSSNVAIGASFTCDSSVTKRYCAQILQNYIRHWKTEKAA